MKSKPHPLTLDSLLDKHRRRLDEIANRNIPRPRMQHHATVSHEHSQVLNPGGGRIHEQKKVIHDILMSCKCKERANND